MIRKTLLALAILAGAAGSTFAATHRLATFNVRYTGAATDTGGKDWGARGPHCSAAILDYDLDVIGFQELSGTGRSYRNPNTGRTQIDDLKAWLPAYELLTWDRNGTARAEYVGIAYKKARYELLDKGSFFISATPEKFSYGWDTQIETHPRCLGWVKLRDKTSNETFIYAATHTNDGWSLDGPYGSQVVASKMKEIAGDLPVMVVADYNTNRVQAQAQKGLKAYRAAFHDAALDVPADKNFSLPVTNPPCSWTYNAFNPASNTSYAGSEIDYHFYRGMNILERHILAEEFTYSGQQFPISDHFPVYVEAEIAPVSPKTIYVDCTVQDGGKGTKTTPFNTLGKAIAAAEIDDTILVTEGTYNESISPKVSVNIIGGYKKGFSKINGRSVIDGTGLSSSPIDASAYISLTLKNFEIKDYSPSSYNYDGAIQFRGSDLELENILFEGNTAKEYGAAVNVINVSNIKYCESNNIRITDCVFRNNTANNGGAIAAGVYSNFIVKGCSFESNNATKAGGAIYLTFGTPEESRVWFTEAKAIIAESSFTGNTSATQGALYINDEMPNVKVSVTNTTFANNILKSKSGLATIVKQYGGAAISAILTDKPSTSTLTKVGNSILNLGHITAIGNTANIAAAAVGNYNASALNITGDIRIVNSIIAANSTNGTNALPDITLSDATRLKSELRNVFSSAASINFTPNSSSTYAASHADGHVHAAALFDGELVENAFVPAVRLDTEEHTPFVALTSTAFAGKDIAAITVLNRNLESLFSIDINGDGTIGDQLKTDQLGRQRLAKSMPGAVEFSEELISAVEEIGIEAGENAGICLQRIAPGIYQLSAASPLAGVQVIDIAGSNVISNKTESDLFTLDLSGQPVGIYFIRCGSKTYKIINR